MITIVQLTKSPTPPPVVAIAAAPVAQAAAPAAAAPTAKATAPVASADDAAPVEKHARATKKHAARAKKGKLLASAKHVPAASSIGSAQRQTILAKHDTKGKRSEKDALDKLLGL
jgi:hypothetical protein